MNSPINPYQKQLEKFKARDYAEMIGQMDSRAYRAMIEDKAKEFDANQPKPIEVKCWASYDKRSNTIHRAYTDKETAIFNTSGWLDDGKILIELTGSYTP